MSLNRCVHVTRAAALVDAAEQLLRQAGKELDAVLEGVRPMRGEITDVIKTVAEIGGRLWCRDDNERAELSERLLGK